MLRLSRPTLCSALWSCAVHLGALSLAATLVVAPLPSRSQTVKVALLQPPAPLPMGGSQETGKGAAAPRPESRPVMTPSLEAGPLRPRAKPRPIAKKPSPAVGATAASEDTQAQLSTLALPLGAGSVTDEADSDLSDGSTAGNGGEGVGGSGGKTGAGAGSGSGHGGGGGISARPEYGLNPKPPYPLVARRLGAQGVVVLRVQVCEDGRVAAVELAHSSGFALLDESASRTVRQSWRFVPARLNGAPVASWVEVPIQFVLRGSSTP